MGWKGLYLTLGPFIQPKVPKRGQILTKFLEILEIVEFPKSEPFNQKFRGKSQMERKFRKLWYTWQKIWYTLPSFPQIERNAVK